MKIVDVLNRFEGVTQTGMDSWVAMCPTHGDTQQPLLILLEPDGRVLLHCHAGCTVEEICAAVGLNEINRIEGNVDDGGRVQAGNCRRQGRSRQTQQRRQ